MCWIYFQTWHVIYRQDKSPTTEQEAVGEVVLFTYFMLSWTLWHFPFKIQVQKVAEYNQELCLFRAFLAMWEPAAAATFLPLLHLLLHVPHGRLESTGRQGLPNLVCPSAYGRIAR